MDAIAKRYAKAQYMFTVEKGTEVQMYELMKNVVSSFNEFPQMQAVLKNPAVELQQKVNLLLQLGGKNPSTEFANLIGLLSKNNRLDYLFHIAMVYLDLYRADKNIHEAHLVSSEILDEDVLQQIYQWLESELGGMIELKISQDPSLIGGFVLEADGKRWDTSIRKQLKIFHQELIN